MNLWWEVFGVADTALGGWIANGARLLTVVAAILITIYKDRFWKPLAAASNEVDEDEDCTSGRGRAETRILDPQDGLLTWQPSAAAR
jgi:hypothetical protein